MKPSDGCTLAPDGWWRDACVKHDEKYFYGGSAADIKLGAPSAVANLYYYAVRVGGAPGTGLPWRWGFGQGH